MDVSSANWLSDLGMDEYSIIHQCHMDALADHISPAENLRPSFSNSDNSYSSYPTFPTETGATVFSGSSPGTTVTHHHQQPSFDNPPRSIKQLKTTATDSWNSNSSGTCTTAGHVSSPKPISSPTSHFLSFDGSLKSKQESMAASTAGEIYYSVDYPMTRANQGDNKRSYSTMKTPAMAQDHIMAERKRREKLSQRFIALSGIVPGLKKMDKASVLGDTIKYVKELQERLNILEEQTKKRTMESVVFVKRSQVVATDDESSSCDENFDGSCCDSALPEIEAKVSDKDVLLRIHCLKQKGFLPKVLSEVENLRLSVVNSSVFPFGGSTLDITIVAQKNADFSVTMKDLVKDLRVALLKFM